MLEPIRAQHAPEAWPQLDDERMWRFFPALRPATLGDLRRLYEKWERGCPDTEEVWRNWLCREISTRTLVGSMQATISPKIGASYIAYGIYPAHQRKGYAREAAAAVIAYLRTAYGVTEIFAEMDTRNEASYRLAESLGFIRVQKRVAVERRHGIDADEYLYRLKI